ncbi:efflux RND transporter permease subunit [Blastopirellula marina]|uniref:CusA/CzcA family heavy metal efflux RND transporter n=1 Tax=Blastopirellula marina TaxID=124 RepID=A0A2S8GBV2_9BACT|nr:CusA/CzcA family heavy metal efflux RND transporter [Blastopirellula marina]PQO41899.1 CusA/CzcA family heavy metal efflux RND transporter [Blastopirellula marina]PTL46257.1 AcrB/AcrD/AcrF family protein [Blastopirellula marina]
MVQHIIEWSLNNRFIVMLLAVVLLGAGAVSVTTLPLDAVPDLTNVQVQVLTTSPSLGPVEVEQFITFPVENALSGLPKVDEIRSISRFGLSAVTVVFEDGTDIYWARNLITERLQQARESIPPGVGDPQLGPIATGMSEIYQFEVKSDEGYDHSLMELRTILDWQIAFQLRSVPGVIEVNTFGGELKTYEVQVDPNKLLNFKISLNRIFDALQENNANAGGGYITHGAEQHLIRGEGLIQDLDDIRNIVLDSRMDGTPIRISDVAEVRFAPMLRQGAVTRDGNREAVTGMVMMLMGGNSRQVVEDVKHKIEEIERTLPEGVHIDTFYDRTELVEKTIHTIAENIGVGVVLVIIMLFLLLGDIRAGLIVSAAIPLSAMCALIAMKMAGVSANLMSLGAVDFGVIVDGAVVMIENAVRSASHYKRTHGDAQRVPKEVFMESAKEVGTPILFAGIIVIIVFLPILSLQGVEGKMFRPMAFTFMSALTGALVLSVTVMPVMASLFLARRISSGDTFLVRKLKHWYEPMLNYSMRRPATMLGSAFAIFAVSVLCAAGFGVEFVPKLDEGDIAIQAVRLPSVSLETSLEMTKAMERTLLKFPQVETVISKTGRPEIANDPMGVHQTDILVRMKPPEEWPEKIEKTELVEQMQAALEKAVPSNSYGFTQPIELRVQELVAGVRSDIGLSIYGDDLDVLKEQGDKVVRALNQVEGAADVQAQQVAGLPYLRIKIRRDAIGRYGINAADILSAVQVVGGHPVGEVFEGQRRFPLQVRLAPKSRADVETLKQIKIDDPQGRQIPISQLADIVIEEGPSEISRHAIRRRLLVQCNVRGRDLAGFVADAKATIDREVKLPPGYSLTWGGQFQNLEQASQRLMIAVPVALFLIFSLLYITFSSVKLTLLIYLNVPIAATGGIFALWLRGMPFSISAGVGFIALFGIAVMNGVVLIEHIRHLRHTGKDQTTSVVHGAIDRLRPVLMTATCGALGFVPMAISGSAGAEVQRPLATVVIGGLVTCTILTLLVLPAIYGWFEPAETESHA